MRLPRVCSRFLLLAAWPLTAAAQQAPSADSSRTAIEQTLRTWYFSLTHHDWNAVTDEILAAKVVAHRPPPESLLGNQEVGAMAVREIRACDSGDTTFVAAAVIRREGDWASVWVPRCSGGFMAGDNFRLIRFEHRWRLVYIDLYQERIERAISDRR